MVWKVLEASSLSLIEIVNGLRQARNDFSLGGRCPYRDLNQLPFECKHREFLVRQSDCCIDVFVCMCVFCVSLTVPTVDRLTFKNRASYI